MMRSQRLLRLRHAALAVAVIAAVGLSASAHQPTTEPTTQAAKPRKLKLGYVKPGDLPPTSVATGSRGGGEAAVMPVVLAPALTDQQKSAKPPPTRPGGMASAGAEMPAFWFYLPADSGAPVLVTLNQRPTSPPLMSYKSGPLKKGLHRVSLAGLIDGASPAVKPGSGYYEFTVRVCLGDVDRSMKDKEPSDAAAVMFAGPGDASGRFFDVVDANLSALRENPSDAEARRNVEAALAAENVRLPSGAIPNP